MIRCRSNYQRSGSACSTMTRRRMRFAFAAFGGEINLRGFAGDGVPVEVGRQPFPRRDRTLLRRFGIVEHGADRRGQARDVARRDTTCRSAR